ncbi:uncharacterized protein LOC119075167 [Bradysia coprophila]|uniref:uncharacterized protein LOC119075167 n=1 Tax=Bradysia coprophila TaxID=38358 RepID=UPI00187D9DD5|nr:uncharacterized protein LOC119075167 [Bradysia coprophila]
MTEEYQFIGETDYLTCTPGPSDEATELIVNVTEQDDEPAFVDVTSLDDLSDVQENTNVSQTPKNQTVESSFYVKPRKGCDNSKMRVPTSDEKTKTYCCMYCYKRYAKLVPQLQVAHKNEKDVQKFREAPPGSEKRRQIIDKIRKKGQFESNEVEALNKGELDTCRRTNPNRPREAGDFTTCVNCLGAYVHLTRHFNNCTHNTMKGENVAKELGLALEGRCHVDACDDLREIVFPKMRQNETVRRIRFDWLIIAFGNDMCDNYSAHYQQQLIRTSLRKAGKLLVAAMSSSSEISEFSTLYHVKRCNTVIDAIRKVAGFDFTSKKFKSPGTASTLVTLINAIGDQLIIESMKLDDEVKERNTERFLKVFQKDARAKINKIVSVQQAKARRQRNENIPSTEDIHKLASFLDCERDKCFDDLCKEFSYQKWLCLAELTIVSILVFNRRRVGEMQNMECVDFRRREMIEDANNCHKIPEDVKKLIKSRMMIRGKLNRPVPVLLKHSHDECLDLLLHHRENVGITNRNEFVFALPSKTKTIKTVSAGTALRTFSNLCGAQNPSSLRGTKIRKHMASFCGTLNLCDRDVTNVAAYMGHDDQIHRDIYRHNTLDRQVTQMTNYLEAAQGYRIITTIGNISQAGAEQNHKPKPIVDLSDECSSDEEWDESSDEFSDDEADVVTVKASKKRAKQQGIPTITAKSNRKNSRVGTAATNRKRQLSAPKRTRGEERTKEKKRNSNKVSQTGTKPGKTGGKQVINRSQTKTAKLMSKRKEIRI